ncbi:DUF1593 domain-containing protein [Gilvimarinus sp. SDUM040013]|uniref:DUF1593 domain-containing protein n=1 Tax=Gilvimarinus gilvus TaxID=3058038 RepID=A0ABU4S0I5_9GAMM|nr:nucleoside hydrolase-like domain-containing protein [Gilvimarinus sp. SDUM040013]MDO3387890.1 DUF1593 domain-containing protein [Gilvimarinus sp. SDUM040013]MDX6848739.1 DUF1593 domain-containing protein [Gilvimarinus sp. SDUM040013]
MNYFLGLLLVFVPLFGLAEPAHTPLKPRIVVLTDISPNHIEPDDMESIIRLFAYADLFEIEGIVATTGWSSAGDNAEWISLIHDAIDAYEQDLPKLSRRSGQKEFSEQEKTQCIGYWPSPDYLRSVTLVGSQVRGIEHIGADNNTPGSELLIDVASESDERPVWVLAWGGANTMAQAVWQLQNQGTEAELTHFLNKVRLYTITDQDRSYKSGTPFDISAHQWLRREFKEKLFFIWDESAWRYQNGTGKANWEEYAKHVQGKGAMGELYPKYKYGVEGDSPSFFYVLPNGLNNPERPSWGGWGGYFEWAITPDEETYALTNHEDIEAGKISRKYEEKFYPAIFNDFVARMDWVENGSGNRNPVATVDGDQSLSPLMKTPTAGSSITLDGSASFDPDGDNIKVSWWILPEAGTYQKEVEIQGDEKGRVSVTIPSDAVGQSFHIIMEVTDDGTPALTSYRRVIVKPVKDKS